MTTRTWVIVGATSIIAIEFAKLSAKAGNNLVLVGRNLNELKIIAANLELKFQINCKIIEFDAENNTRSLLTFLLESKEELDLMIAQGVMTANNELNLHNISTLIEVNILSLSKIIYQYWHRKQLKKNVLFLSSVAAFKGRAKNSLYAGTKIAIETYLLGLAQNTNLNDKIIIARLGFIDTKTTYGQKGIFYAAPPEKCAKALFKATRTNKRLIYFPKFWKLIMLGIGSLPFFIYRRLSF